MGYLPFGRLERDDSQLETYNVPWKTDLPLFAYSNVGMVVAEFWGVCQTVLPPKCSLPPGPERSAGTQRKEGRFLVQNIYGCLPTDSEADPLCRRQIVEKRYLNCLF